MGMTEHNGQKFYNPNPVVACLVPMMTEDGKLKLLGVKRNIEPGYGKIGLPGGYLDSGEEWRVAMAREVREETQLNIDPSKIKLHDVKDILKRDQIIVIGEYDKDVRTSEVPDWSFNDRETQEIVLIEPGEELAFSSHTEAAKAFFYENKEFVN